MRRTFLSFQAAVYVILLVTSAEARAALIRVCDGVACDHPTIQEAIDAASPGDTILVNKLIHTEAGIEVTKNLTIKGIGQHATVIQASADAPPDMTAAPRQDASRVDRPGRVFTIDRRVQAEIQQMTIRHGYPGVTGKGGGGILNLGSLSLHLVTVELNASSKWCGGIQNEGTLVVDASRIQNNTARDWGGGICNQEGSVRLVNDTIVRSNKSLENGAGVHNRRGQLTVAGSTIEENRISNVNNHYMSGAGIFSLGGRVRLDQARLVRNSGDGRVHGGGMSAKQASVDILLSTIRSNSADSYGAMHFLGGQILIIDSTIDRNFARSFVGGLSSENAARVIIRGSTFSRNRGILGAHQIQNRGFRLELSNSTVAGQGLPFLTGISNKPGSVLEIINSTIANHRSRGISNQGTARISNSIVAGSGNADCAGNAPQAVGPNLSSDGSCQGFSISNGMADLQPLALNGGPTETHALGDRSDAIDAGDDSICTAVPVSAEDQRHAGRPQGQHCDLGAYERAGLAETVAISLLFGGTGSAIATWVHGICNWDGTSQEQTGDCIGEVETGQPVTLTITPQGAGEITEHGCDSLVLEGDTYDCTVETSDGHDTIIPITVVLPELVVESHPSGTGAGTVSTADAPPMVTGESECKIKPLGETEPQRCVWNAFIVGEPLTFDARADASSLITEWIGCEQESIAPDGKTGSCTITPVGGHTVTVKMDLEPPADNTPEAVVTIDHTACGGGDFPGVQKLRFLEEALVAVASVFDALSNEIQCVIHFDVRTDEGSTVLQQTGDMGEFGTVESFSEIVLLKRGEVHAYVKDRRVDDSSVGMIKVFRLDETINEWFDSLILWQGLSFNPTIESFDKIAANDPYFVVQAQFESEGPGLLSADLNTDPAGLSVLFHAGEPVGDGFTFDAFHIAAQPGIALNPLGDGAVIADVIDPGTGSAVDAVLTYRADAPGASLLLHEGQETETPGVTISRLIDVAMDGDGVIAALGRVSGTGISSTNDEAVWVCMAALCSIAVQEGMEPDGMPGVRLRFPGSPVVRGGMLLMRTVLEGAGIDSTNNFGLLLVDLATGSIELVAQKGDAFAGNTIRDFRGKAFSNDIPLAAVLLNDFTLALGRIDAGGLVSLIGPGDEFTLPDGTLGTVASVVGLTETGGEDGRRSAVGGGGYAIVVNFADGRQGIVACTAACLEGGG